jgi:copper(I)-binding protein
MNLDIFRALSTFSLALCLSAVNAGELVVTDPWIWSAPPNAPALGAFMLLENTTDSDVFVVDARSSLQVDRVELHRSMMTDAVMKMLPQKTIPVPARSSTLLKPGSWHVMLIDPGEVPAPGEVVQLTLIYGDGSEQVVSDTVRQGKRMMDGHDHGE